MHCLHTTVLRWFWLFVVALSELGLFFISTATCTWPVPPGAKEGAHHVLIVADPQILDGSSYPGRNALLMALSQFIVDMNLRKAWMVAKRKHPDTLIFLGDMMDNGRADLSQTDYQVYLDRFHDIFDVPSTLPTYYIAGNHDVGLRQMPAATPDFRDAQLRFETSFGPLNQHIHLANHSLVLIDAVGLAGRPHSVEALPYELEDLRLRRSQFTRDGVESPVVLFTHIPLYRPDSSDCGPLRERGSINTGFGYGYQNLLSPETSRMLLDAFQPSLVFSGDDHDYCAYTHPAPSYAPEITVKSISMAMGVRRPGFHLLSLAPAAPPAHRPCALPDQLAVYLRVYLPLFVLTLAVAAYMGATGQEVVVVTVHDREKLNLGLLEEGVGAKKGRARSGSAIRLRSRGLGGVRRVLRDLGSIAWPPAALYVLITVVLFW
ncbi:Metallo-dependent phosphatase [Auriscalpium vulgare]|uniref:Metallo-dependent phosphatase n=1 Tax=Auriscalpium vulgare TaxID=40419 RepID=A0ACB8S5Z2_9AGAM|nr:Metallo-dependent phosphatase [Auriscalpium vulgare]